MANFPEATSTAVISSFLAGHSWLGSQAPITSRRSASGSSGEARAILPIRMRARVGVPGRQNASA